MTKKFYFVLASIFIVMLVGISQGGLTESSEARYAEIGREMALSNDFLHPRMLGIGHYHKPPVTYAITALGYKIFGFNEFGARFFLAVALLLQLLLVYKMGKLWFEDRKTGIFAALIYFTFPIVLASVLNLTTDAYLNTFILSSIYCFLVAKLKKKKSFLYLGYALLGIAFLIKGPVAFLPVALFMICYKISTKEPLKPSKHTVLGIILLLGISASWFIAIVLEKPNLLDHFIEDQIVKRSVDASQFKRSKPFWYYLVFAPLLCLPWTVPFVYVLIAKRKRLTFTPQLKTLGFSCLAILLVFSLFSSKLIFYILPLYPLLALFFVGVYKQVLEHEKNYFLLTYKVGFGILTGMAIALLCIPTFEYKIWFSILALALIGSYFYWWNFKAKASKSTRLFALSTGATLLLLLLYFSFAPQNELLLRSFKPQYAFIEKQKKDTKDYKVIVYDYRLPSAAFYLGDRVVTVTNTNYESLRDTRFERDSSWTQSYIDLRDPNNYERFKSLLKDSTNIIITKDRRPIPDSLEYLTKHFKVKEFGDWRVHY